MPDEMRGVHVTMALASLPGKLDEYLAIPGLNTIELDVKDENGEVGFLMPARSLARKDRSGEAVLQGGRRRGEDARGGRLSDRPGRRLRGPDAARRSGPTWRSAEWRLGLAELRRARLDEPVRQARLGLQRRDREGGRPRRLRRDPVRLRALPERRPDRDGRLPAARSTSPWAGRSPASSTTPRSS